MKYAICMILLLPLVGCVGRSGSTSLSNGDYTIDVPDVFPVCTNTTGLNVYGCGQLSLHYKPYQNNATWETWVDFTRGSADITLHPTNGCPIAISLEFDGTNTYIHIDHGSNHTVRLDFDLNGDRLPNK